MLKSLVKYQVAVVSLTVVVLSLAESSHAMGIQDLQDAANRGEVAAKYDMAGAYFTGNGVPMNRRKAAGMTQTLAEQGYAPAQYTLGRFYDVGGYLGENQPIASHWYKLSAEQGFTNAQAALGYQYYHGYGLDKDWEKSGKWLSRAANQGNPDAIKNLDILKESVRGLAAAEQRLKDAILEAIMDQARK